MRGASDSPRRHRCCPAPCEGRLEPVAAPPAPRPPSAQGLWSPARAAPPLGVHSKPPTQHHPHQGWPRPRRPLMDSWPHRSGDGDPGVPVCLSPRLRPQKRHSTQMGTLERSPASRTLGEVAAPAQSPFPAGAARQVQGRGWQSLAGVVTVPASMLNTDKQAQLMLRQAHGCGSNRRPGDARCCPAPTLMRGHPAQDPRRPGLWGEAAGRAPRPEPPQSQAAAKASVGQRGPASALQRRPRKVLQGPDKLSADLGRPRGRDPQLRGEQLPRLVSGAAEREPRVSLGGRESRRGGFSCGLTPEGLRPPPLCRGMPAENFQVLP